MIRQTSDDPILLDIEVQRDFFRTGGSCYTPAALPVLKNVYGLIDWAWRHRIPVLSTVLRVRRRERGPLAGKPHCVEGTDGEKKLSRTVLPRRINLGMRSTTDLPRNLLGRYRQVIFEKRSTNIFTHAGAERLITELPRRTFVVCGAGLAKGIAEAAIGLRAHGFGVIVACDAVLDLGDPMAAMARMRMEAKGVVFAPTSEIISPRPARRVAPLRPLRRLTRRCNA
ncbi:MAG TPA: isochorismatase family protein [Phycisphaerae bacterium]|nr:isochorismatase family protein [Phycisphaerae bacterium]